MSNTEALPLDPHDREPVDQATIDCWRANYGLDKRPPAEAAKWWSDNMRGLAPAGCVAALGVALDELDALRAALAQKQEPVAWQAVGGSIWGHKTSEDDRPLYTEGSWNEGYKHGQWQAKHCAALAQPAPAMNNGDPDISRILNDNLASLYIEDEPAAQPVPDAVPVAWRVNLDGLWIHARDRDNLLSALNVEQAEPLYAAAHPQPAPLTEAEMSELAAAAETPAWGDWYSDEDALLRYTRAVEARRGIVPAPTTDTKEQP